MTPSLLQELIRRYRAGTATADERQALEAHWQQALIDDAAVTDLPVVEQKALEHRLYQGTLDRIRQKEPGAFRPVRRLTSRPWLRVAAGLGGLLLLCSAWWVWSHPSADPVAAYQTRYGEKKQFVLPDGSVVWLNGHSSLRYARDTAGNRQVWLTGEALFSVKHLPDHRKFRVHTTNKLTIEVLGTVFNVTDRRGRISVVLRSGSVRVTDATHRQADVLMKPGEMVNQSPERPILARSTVRAAPRLAWTAGTMLVENKPLGEIFDWIEDTYGLRVACSPALRAETFAGTIPTDSIDLFFAVLPKLYQVQVRQAGRTYQLTPAADTPQ